MCNRWDGCWGQCVYHYMAWKQTNSHWNNCRREVRTTSTWKPKVTALLDQRILTTKSLNKTDNARRIYSTGRTSIDPKVLNCIGLPQGVGVDYVTMHWIFEEPWVSSCYIYSSIVFYIYLSISLCEPLISLSGLVIYVTL